MKNLFSIVFTLFISFNVSAQKTLGEGTIKMEITEVNASDPQQAMMLESMKGSVTEITFKGEQNAVNMSMMGGMIAIQVNTDRPQNKFDMLMDAMGQKIWVESALDKTETPEQKENIAKAVVTYDKTKTKTLAGYNCYEFKVTIPDNPMVVTGYLTEDIKFAGNIIQGLQSLKMNGFPLEYVSGNDDFKMTMTVKEVSDKLDAKKFVIDTTGYKKMTMEELSAMTGGMGF
jgi:hypothetical protein